MLQKMLKPRKKNKNVSEGKKDDKMEHFKYILLPLCTSYIVYMDIYQFSMF